MPRPPARQQRYYCIETASAVERLIVGLELSPRQAVVAYPISTGQPEKIVAKSLGISIHTVHTHIKRTYRHLAVTGNVEMSVLVALTINSTE